MASPLSIVPAPRSSARGPTAAADQFAWCVALWEALDGRPPFRGETIKALADAKRARITSYNVCYTKLLRVDAAEAAQRDAEPGRDRQHLARVERRVASPPRAAPRTSCGTARCTRSPRDRPRRNNFV